MNGHIGLKYIYFRACRKSDLLHSRSWKSVGIWLALGLTCWVVAWIISEGIPVFSNLNSLIVCHPFIKNFQQTCLTVLQSALFASWFSYGLSGIYWLHLNYGQWFSSPKKILLTILNVGIALIGLILCALGLYASGTAIHNDASSTVFTCANTDT